MSPEFLRQRRNLIGINVIIILFKLAEISTNKLTVLGTTFEIGKPEVIPYFIWTLWVYFILRYYQYLNLEKEYKISELIKEEFKKSFANYMRKNKYKQKNGSDYTDFILKNKGLYKWNYALHGRITSDGNYGELMTKEISILLVLLWSLKSTITVSLKSNQFTEFILPLLLALAAPIISVVA